MVCLDHIQADHIPSIFLKAVFHKFYLVGSWILCLKYASVFKVGLSTFKKKN